MRKLLIFLLLSISPTIFASPDVAFTKSLLYAAADESSVKPGEFHSISVDEAKTQLLVEMKQACRSSNPQNVSWETWIENAASYGRQRFWIKGIFQCGNSEVSDSNSFTSDALLEDGLTFSVRGHGYFCYQTFEEAIANAQAQGDIAARKICAPLNTVQISLWTSSMAGCGVTVYASFTCALSPPQGVAKIGEVK